MTGCATYLAFALMAHAVAIPADLAGIANVSNGSIGIGVVSDSKMEGGAFIIKSEPSTGSIESKPKICRSYLLGLGECDSVPPSTSSGDLTSSLVRRVPNGRMRQTADLTGEFYIDVKVYNKSEVASYPKKDRWKKAAVAVQMQLNRDTPQWKELQLFLRRTVDLFNSSEPVFISD